MESHEKRSDEKLSPEELIDHDGPVAATDKTKWERLWPVIACGAGLFSDGYLNGVIGSVNTMLSTIYKKEYTSSPAQANVSSIAFAGTVVGQLFFGWTSDHFSRKWSLLVSTIILIVFAALGAGYGAGGSVSGLLSALTAYRFFLGIGIGGEYPAGSVGCAESTGELKAGTRNRWFALFTNVQIDFGFVVAAFVPMVVVLATGENHLRAAWRICLGLGVIPPLSLLYLRIKLQEPEPFKRNSMSRVKTPWWLVIKFYWFRLAVVSAIWFMYDFSSYSFGIFSSALLANLLGDNSTLFVTFGWNTLLNFFYMPGCIPGAWLSDYWGPRKTLGYIVAIQGIFGFLFAGVYGYINQPRYVGAFVVLYGLFIALGEAGPGNCIGMIASKTSATAVRGQYYGIAAACGKIGAFVGNRVLLILYNRYADTDPTKAGQYPFFISSAMCLLSAALCLAFVPEIGQEVIDEEDAKFKVYLSEHGFDISKMGVAPSESTENIVESGKA